jgi:hypothetical protein
MPYNNYLGKYLKVSSLCKNAQSELGSTVLHYRSFKQTWSDRSMIWSGSSEVFMVQPAFRTGKVSVFYSKNGSVAVYVDESLAYIIQYPNYTFSQDVENKNLEFVYLAKDKYERKEYNLGNTPL